MIVVVRRIVRRGTTTSQDELLLFLREETVSIEDCLAAVTDPVALSPITGNSEKLFCQSVLRHVDEATCEHIEREGIPYQLSFR